MNSSLQVLKIFCTLACIILSFSAISNGAPTSSNELSDVTNPVTADGSLGNLSPLVPQVGFLEERSELKTGENKVIPNGNTGNGILVPVVSVVNSEDSSAKAANPLVALLPAPPEIKQSADAEKLPVIATLPIVPLYDQPETASKPEIRRLPRDAPPGTTISTSRSYNGDSLETMDVAEDIVFRPLFKIRQNTARNSPYSATNLRGDNAYRRYNVNGYYRLPYKQPRYRNYNFADNDDDDS